MVQFNAIYNLIMYNITEKILVNTWWICIVFVIGFKVVGNSSSICFTWSSVIFTSLTDVLQCRNDIICSNHVSTFINKSVSWPLYYCSDVICCSLPMTGLKKISSGRTKAKVKYCIYKQIKIQFVPILSDGTITYKMYYSCVYFLTQIIQNWVQMCPNTGRAVLKTIRDRT